MWWCTKIDKCEVWYEQLQLTRIMFTFHFVFKMNALFLSSWWTGHHAQAHWPCNSVTQSQKYTKTNMIAVLVAPRAQWPGDPLKVVQGRSDPAHSLIWLLCTPPSSLSSYNHLDLLSRVQPAALLVPSKGCECLEMWNWIMMPFPFSWLKTGFVRQKVPTNQPNWWHTSSNQKTKLNHPPNINQL